MIYSGFLQRFSRLKLLKLCGNYTVLHEICQRTVLCSAGHDLSGCFPVLLYTISTMIVLFALLFLLLGVVLVEVVGYWVHRLIFHYGVFGAKLRRPHVQHHLEDYPVESLRPQTDTYKSAADPLWHVIGAVILLLLLMLTLLGILAWWQGALLAAGSVAYAKFVVSWMHMQFHVPNSPLRRSAYFQRLVVFHDVHHYVRANYGIVFMGMDRLFGTFVSELPKSTQDIFPGYGRR